MNIRDAVFLLGSEYSAVVWGDLEWMHPEVRGIFPRAGDALRYARSVAHRCGCEDPWREVWQLPDGDLVLIQLGTQAWPRNPPGCTTRIPIDLRIVPATVYRRAPQRLHSRA